MNNIQASQVIISLFEQLADYTAHPDALRSNRALTPPELGPLQGMYFAMYMSAENHGYEDDGNTYHPEWKSRFDACIHFIILRNRRVYAYKAYSHPVDNTLEKIPVTAWKNISNHDSCWRDAVESFIRCVERDAWRAYFENTPEDARIRRAPNSIHYFNKFGEGWLQHEPVSFVQVTRGAKVDDYHDSLAEVKRLKIKMEVVADE